MPADLRHLAAPGAEIAVRVTPRAASEAVEVEAGRVRVRVTAPPADGRANEAVLRLLAAALGLPKSQLALVRGARGRDKTFRVLPD